jgi:hypothetical protein
MKLNVIIAIIAILVIVFSPEVVFAENEIENFPYHAATLRKIRRSWQASFCQDASHTINATVHFQIQRDGSLNSPPLNSPPKIETPSGSTDFDNEVIKAVTDSAPFSTLPNEFKGQYCELHITFECHKRKELPSPNP